MKVKYLLVIFLIFGLFNDVNCQTRNWWVDPVASGYWFNSANKKCLKVSKLFQTITKIGTIEPKTFIENPLDLVIVKLNKPDEYNVSSYSYTRTLKLCESLESSQVFYNHQDSVGALSTQNEAVLNKNTQNEEAECQNAEAQVNAETIDSNTLNKLAWCYANGVGVTENYEAATKLYRRAGNSTPESVPKNIGNDGSSVLQAQKVEIDACKHALNKINEGSEVPSIQNKLAWCYANGIGVPENYTEATELYRKAGSTEASGQPPSDPVEPSVNYSSPYTIYTGPRGGRFHYSASGKKVYQKRR